MGPVDSIILIMRTKQACIFIYPAAVFILRDNPAIPFINGAF